MKCNHAYGMVFDDDFCACSLCGETWTLGSKGWVSSKRAQYYRNNNVYRGKPNYKKTSKRTSW